MAKDTVRMSDLERMRSEIVAEVAAHFDATMGEAIVRKILDRAADRAAHVQKAELEAKTGRDEAEKQTRLFEERLARLKKEIGELSAAHHEKQVAFEKLTADYDALVPVVSELRKEHASHIARVQKLAG